MSKNAKPALSEKIQQLNSQVEWFYGSDFTLDHATEKYKEAIALAKDIDQDLKELKNEIEVLSQDFSKE